MPFLSLKCCILTKWYLTQNVNEDTDEMFDDLMKKYGKVVFRKNDQKSPSAELDDDAESLSCKFISQLTKSRILISCRNLCDVDNFHYYFRLYLVIR